MARPSWRSAGCRAGGRTRRGGRGARMCGGTGGGSFSGPRRRKVPGARGGCGKAAPRSLGSTAAFHFGREGEGRGCCTRTGSAQPAFAPFSTVIRSAHDPRNVPPRAVLAGPALAGRWPRTGKLPSPRRAGIPAGPPGTATTREPLASAKVHGGSSDAAWFELH